MGREETKYEFSHAFLGLVLAAALRVVSPFVSLKSEEAPVVAVGQSSTSIGITRIIFMRK